MKEENGCARVLPISLSVHNMVLYANRNSTISGLIVGKSGSPSNRLCEETKKPRFAIPINASALWYLVCRLGIAKHITGVKAMGEIRGSI